METTMFSIEEAIKYFPKILSHLNITLLIVLSAFAIGTILGIILSLLRLNKVFILNQLTIIYISFIRGTPIIIQMFIIFYGLPMILSLFNINISKWDKIYFVIITYSLNVAALLSEIFRTSILSVPISQSEAAYSVGLTKMQAFYRIVIPQALVISLPSIGTMLVNLLQDTSVAFQLGIIDVMGEITVIGASTRRTMEGYVDAAIIFFVLSIVVEKVFGAIEKRLVVKRHR